MAKLFKNKIIKDKLEKYEIPELENKLEVVRKWHDMYKAGKLQKQTETQCEQAFNKDIFQDVLEYKDFTHDEYNLQVQQSTEASGQRPDATLGYFTKDKERVIAVCEIKDVNTSLDKSQKREGNLSPVQQAFKYKPQYKECAFVIATNFFEIRLLKDNQLDYESFTLESLTNPKNDYFEFKKFYFLLNAENFISKTGKTKTEKLLSEIRVTQEKITKDFYSDYKKLKQELIKNIVKNNTVTKQDFYVKVVEKAQKIIDRIVFAAFCEDIGLLPEHTLKKVIEHAENSYVSLWDMVKGFFHAIDSGSPKLEIPDGYNGGLFAKDKELDDLKIDDEVCKNFLEIGKYDFEEDLSVNILGHIFEQSISDIEELKNIGEAKETDKKQSKRKKDGIFYTPDYITDYIVKNAVGKWLEERENEIKKDHKLKEDINDKNYQKRALAVYTEYKTVLQNIKVLDPACGSGAFLVKVFDYLLAENKRVGEILADLRGGKAELFETEQAFKEILKNNIYGVDLNPESVEITKLSLWLKTAQKGKKLASLHNNIKCGNSLIDDVEVAGERAFKWEDEFAEIMGNGGFDVVVGNPPYVLCQPSNTNDKVLSFFKNNFEVASYKIDLFHLFFEKSINLIKKNGLLSFITPNTYLTNKYIEKLRIFILRECSVNDLVIFDDDVFEDASVDTSTIVLKKENDDTNKINIGKMFSQGELKKLNLIEQNIWQESEGFLFNIKAVKENKLQNCVLLEDIAKTYFGIQAYDRKNSISETKDNSEYIEIIDGGDIFSFSESFPKIYFNFKEENIKSGGDWGIYKKERIVIRQIGKVPIVGICFPNILTSNTIYNIFLKEENKNIYDLKYLLAILNSTFIKNYWLDHFSDNKQTFPKIKGYQLKKLPIPKISKSEQIPFIEKADLMLKLNKELHEKTTEFLDFIKQKYNLEKLSKKLQKFYELEFVEFKKQLKIKKIDMEEEMDLMNLFNKKSEETNLLKAEIDKQDSIIDEMVFDLYGLGVEERAIILNEN